MEDEDSQWSEADAADLLNQLQHERAGLLAALRDVEDESVRAGYLQRLAENRAETLRLRQELGLASPQEAEVSTSRSFVVETDEHPIGSFEYGDNQGAERGPARPRAAATRARPTAAVSRSAQPAELRLTTGGALILGAVVIGLVLAAWLVSGRSSDGGSATEAGNETDVAATDASASDAAANIASALSGMGLTDVIVEQRGSVIHIIGSVATEAERTAAIGAAQALAGETPVDASMFVVAATAAATAGDGSDTSRPAALQAEIDRVLAATPIIFASGSTELTELHRRILNNVANSMMAYQDLTVTVVGFADVVGSDDANEQLSLTRAENVKAYLIGEGVPEGNLLVDARGETTASGSEGLAILERRVEFEVVAAGGVPPAAGEGGLRVAVLTPSARNDLAFSQAMIDSIETVAAERGGVEVTVVDSMFVPDEAMEQIRTFAESGFDLVIAHGSQYGAGVQEVAGNHPDVTFAWGTAADTFGLPNVYAYDSASEQGGYVLGAMSALVSNSNTIGVVAPIELGDPKRYVDGFRRGAEAETAARVVITYTDSFSDVALAAEAAEAHLGEGVDVMTGTSQMVVGAVTVASENNVPWFGTQANQSSLAPDLVVASMVNHWEPILREIIADVDAGVYDGRTLTADLANGGIVVEYNDGFSLDPAVRQRGDALVAAITSQELVVPIG